MRKTPILLIVLILLSLFTIKCTRSTDTLYREGRILARLESPSSKCEMLYLKIIATVGGIGSFEVKIFDFDSPSADWYMQANQIESRDDALNWNDFYNKRLIDVAGQILEGGRDADVTVSQPQGHSQSASVPSFQIDGNAIIRIYFAESSATPGAGGQLEAERLQ